MDNKIFDLPFVRGISVTLPRNRVILKDLDLGKVNPEDVIKVTGIREVYQSDEDITSVDLCANAAEHLFEELNFDKSNIDGIVFATVKGDYLSPGNGYILQDHLGLSKRCVIFDTNQACAGWVNGLFQAFLLVQTGYCKNVLLCAGDTPSKSVNSKDKSMKMLMSDAGVASIISADESCGQESAFSFYNDGNVFKALYMPAGGYKIPFKAGVTDVEEVDDQGNVRTLMNSHMDGLEVMAFVMNAAPKAVKDAMETLGWNKDDINVFAFHQANKTMLEALCKRLRITADKVPMQLEYYGNTAAVSVPLTLCVEHPKKAEPWNKVVLCAFGNGMACAAAALNLENTHFCNLNNL